MCFMCMSKNCIALINLITQRKKQRIFLYRTIHFHFQWFSAKKSLALKLTAQLLYLLMLSIS